jgi:hypothetical protein
MAYKPLKKRYMTQEFEGGPLSKMINKAVEERVNSMLKNTEDEMEMSDWEKVSSETTDLDMSEDPRYESGTTTTDVYSRTGEDDPFEGEKTDSDTWQRQYEEAMEGGGSKGMQEYVKKYNMDGTAKTEYKEETTTDLTPAELEKIQKREVGEIDPVDPRTPEEKPSYLQTPVGSKSIMELFGVDPSRGGNLTDNAKNFYDMSFSTDNPVLEVLNDDKWMRKARKAYEKKVETRGNAKSPSGRKSQNKYRSNMPFERWVMTHYKPKGGEGGLAQRARIWEGDNSGDTDNSQFQLPDGTDAMDREIKGAGYVAASRNRKSNPFDRYAEEQKAQVEGGGTPPPGQFNTSSHMPTRTMAFRKPQANTRGFKMKRYAK